MPAAVSIASRTPSVHVVQITDTHVSADAAARYDGVDTFASLNTVIDAVLAREEGAPDLVLATGDLADDPAPASYERLLGALQRLPSPVCCLPGNHDDPDQLRRSLASADVSAPRLVRCGNWSLPLLNTCVPGRESGRLAEAELAFLEACLQSPGGAHVLVCLHHPPVPVGSPWMDAMGLENGADLFGILDSCRRVRGVLWGHIHQEFEGARDTVRLLGTPSTCVQFTPGADDYFKSDEAPAYRDLILRSDGVIQTMVRRVAL